jgi:hypothetical protein
VIDDEGAFAGETSCAFKSRKQVAGAWEIVAACTNRAIGGPRIFAWPLPGTG